MNAPVIGFAGLTHLGIVSGVAAAAKGFNVVGFDANPERVAAVARGNLLVEEPELDALFAEHRARISISPEASALSICDLVYLATDVPTDEDGVSDLGPIQHLFSVVAPHMSDLAILAVLCQVPPGFTRALAFPAERLCYQVETLIFGRAVSRAMQPERFIVGLHNPESGLPKPLATYLEAFGCPILPMRLESAELCKISINICLVASISAANALAELCEAVGADWEEIIPALRLDRRIGSHAYINPGLGLSGGNLERDLTTTVHLAGQLGTNARIVAASIEDSAYRKNWALRQLRSAGFPKNQDRRLGILGLSYKENTASTKNSPALTLVNALPDAEIIAYDPLVTVKDAGIDAQQASSAMDAVFGADAVALMTPWPAFREIDVTELACRMSGRLLIDPYRLIDQETTRKAGLDHRLLGKASEKLPTDRES